MFLDSRSNLDPVTSRQFGAVVSLLVSISATTIVGVIIEFGHARDRLEFVDAVVRLFGLEQFVLDRGEGRVAIVLPSFSGAKAIDRAKSLASDGVDVPASFAQGEDDISSDFFFGKRDVVLASQVASAFARVGLRDPIFVEDRSIWNSLKEGEGSRHNSLNIEHDGERLTIDSLVLIGLWSNVVTTALADWESLPEFRMLGDPESHSTRVVRMSDSDGQEIVSLNARDESAIDEVNPAIVLSRRLRDVHITVLGGATSISTLRLSEHLSREGSWRDLVDGLNEGVSPEESRGGAWFALQCPNSTERRFRTRVIKMWNIKEPLDASLIDAATNDNEMDKAVD